MKEKREEDFLRHLTLAGNSHAVSHTRKWVVVVKYISDSNLHLNQITVNSLS